MSRKLLVVGLIGALAITAVGALAAPPTPPRPRAERVQFARVLAFTLHEIAEGIGTLHRALPMIAPRLEPIQDILKDLHEVAKEPAEIEPKDVQMELIKLNLLLHRLLFDLEQEARQLAEFRESVRQFVGRFTQGMEPRLAEKFHQFAQGLVELVQERLEERTPGAANPEELGRTIGRLKAAVNRLDLLLLRSLELRPAGK